MTEVKSTSDDSMADSPTAPSKASESSESYPCPCGSGRPFGTCCMPRLPTPTDEELAALAYFLNAFRSRRWKKDLVSQFSEADLQGLVSAIFLTSCGSDEEIAAVCHEDDFVRMLHLCEAAVVTGVVTPELKAATRRNYICFVRDLVAKGRQIEQDLLVPKLDELQQIKLRHPEKARRIRARLLEDQFKRTINHALKVKYDTLKRCIQIAMALPRQFLNDHILRMKIDGKNVAELLAFSLTHIENMVGPLREIDPAWHAFPLKWCTYDMTLPEIRVLLRNFKEGADLTEYFVSRYRSGAEAILQQYTALSAVPVLRRRHSAIREAFVAYDHGLYRASLCLALPIVEGMLWDFAVVLHRKHGDVRPPPEDALRIGNVLESERLCAELDEHFIKYFCEELYPARNPVLHGRVPAVACAHDAAKKLATIEYLTRRIDTWITNDTVNGFDSLPPELMDRLLRGVAPPAAELPIAENVSESIGPPTAS